MKIKVNGAEAEIEKEVTVEGLLVIQQVKTPEYVTVQLNDRILNRDEFASTVVREGDTVEFLYFMGGGSLC